MEHSPARSEGEVALFAVGSPLAFDAVDLPVDLDGEAQDERQHHEVEAEFAVREEAVLALVADDGGVKLRGELVLALAPGWW